MMTHQLPFGINVVRKGLKRSIFRDFYHLVLQTSWWQFLASVFSIYLIMNSFFAFLYYLGGDTIINAEPYSFWEAFVFSFQTSTTIGYGHYLPANGYAHAITIVDAMCGIFFVAMTTGLAIAKFARPTAKVMFSKNVLINLFNGKNTLMFRVANARASYIVDASLTATLVISEMSSEGHDMRRMYDLNLIRNRSPMFFLSWLVMHTIDEKSPLFGLSKEDMQKRRISLVISLTGIDDWSAQMVHANHFYRFEDFLIGRNFVDMIATLPDGTLEMDYEKFHQLKEI